MEMLRSILSYGVQQYDASGVPFKTHFHVPEIHPVYGSVVYEREDEGHLLTVL